MYLKRLICLAVVLAAAITGSFAQKVKKNEYPSLLWEITGNGLSRPSYLFGTMHISNKMVFHLSDSFYYAIKSVDAVALELNPEIWQDEMVRLEKMKQEYVRYTSGGLNDYLHEDDFRINKFDDELKLALSTEPAVVNNLLYRSYKAQEDFEEDTFLDLYIHQTGKKLGKRSTGVEAYFEAEKIMLEAYADMAKEKKRRQIDTDGESAMEVYQKMQNAYRQGDLDLLDSLDRMMERSDAFREKFLYKRNEIQASSIDTIIKKSSLFVGVGAAHLPGKRGVIELLRKMGYRLRPIRMKDRAAVQKEAIDKLRSPVVFATRQSEDGFFSVDMPGPLYKMPSENSVLDRRQYSDMSNGSYYLVTRVKTNAAFAGKTEAEVLRQIDSLLYENIPGKIVLRKSMERNGYKGYDITNRNRSGSIQRYNIFVTPFEVIIFKMGGKEAYVKGVEATRFFSSIRLRPMGTTAIAYTPPQGGFSIKFPQEPAVSFNETSRGGVDRWEYSAVDKTTGNVYLLLKKSVFNLQILEKDSFDLAMVEESFRSADFFQRQLSRRYGKWKGYPCLDVQEKLKDSSMVTARYILKGPHYYVLAARSNKNPGSTADFFSSFSFEPVRYRSSVVYTDTFMRIKVKTPFAPQIDPEYRQLVEKAQEAAKESGDYGEEYSYGTKLKSGLFQNDSTGEMIGISVQEYPRFFYAKDSASFWKEEVDEYYDNNEMIQYRKEPVRLADGAVGFRYLLRDTGCSRSVQRTVLLKGKYLYRMATVTDTLSTPGAFVSNFFESFQPGEDTARTDLFSNRVKDFFDALFSKDSVLQKEAVKALDQLYYGEQGAPLIMAAINRLRPADKDYYDIKTRLIGELGLIKDTTRPVVVNYLRQLYEAAGDTSLFQNAVVKALAKHSTTDAVQLLKQLLLQDPPIFEDSYGYSSLFSPLEDTLKLAKTLFPELLQLTSIEDYKGRIISLLIQLVDSGHIVAKDYESYFPKLYFDARVALKKLQGRDERILEKENKQRDAPDDDELQRSDYDDSEEGEELAEYGLLMLPFYDKNPAVPRFFERMLRARGEGTPLEAALLLLRNKKPVPDSLLVKLGLKNPVRIQLYNRLKKIGQLQRFPAIYNKQELMARACMLDDKFYSKMDSVVLVGKQLIGCKDTVGNVYFYKYRIKKTDDWKMGISGLQPADEKLVSTDNQLVSMLDKKLKADEPELEQYNKALKKILFSLYQSGRYFFVNNSYGYPAVRNYED